MHLDCVILTREVLLTPGYSRPTNVNVEHLYILPYYFFLFSISLLIFLNVGNVSLLYKEQIKFGYLHVTASNFQIEVMIASCRQNKIKGTFLLLLNSDAIEKDNYLLGLLCKLYLV